MNCKKTLGLIGFLIFTHLAWSQVFEETQTFSKSFNANATTTVHIANKYGTILVSTWEKDSVKINVTLSIYERTENRFKKIKDNIDIEFSQIQNKIKAETNFGSRYSSLIKDVAEATNYLNSSSNQSKIEYHVFVPKYINMTIENKYGDVILPSLKGNVNVILSNGNIHARNLDGHTEMNLSFGNAEIDNLRQAALTTNFIHLNVKEAGSMSLDSRSSEVNISAIETLRLNSRRDKVEVNSASSIYGETYFSKIYLNKVGKECQLKSTYGDISLLHMNPDFTKLEVNSQACDLNIELKQPNSYSALIKAIDAPLDLPSELKSGLPNYKDRIGTEAVKFDFKQGLSSAKVKINISGADLKISHQ